MKYIDGKRINKNKIHVTLELTTFDLWIIDDLVHCICTVDNEEHPLEEKYEKWMNKTEKVMWKFVDHIEPKLEKKRQT